VSAPIAAKRAACSPIEFFERYLTEGVALWTSLIAVR